MSALIYGAWEGGVPSGTVIKSKTHGFYLRFGKNIAVRCSFFATGKFGGLDKAREAAIHMRDILSLDLGLTANQYRLLTNQETGDAWYEMSLTHGKTMWFDVPDLARMTEQRWMAAPGGRSFYAVATNSKTKKTLAHNLLTGWELVDHIDGDGLNNRRSNLRPRTRYENTIHRKLSFANTSGVAGVYYRAAGDRKWARYVASIGGGDNKEHASYSVLQWGEEEAFRLAVEWRRKKEQERGYTHVAITHRRRGPDDETTEWDAGQPRHSKDWQD